MEKLKLLVIDKEGCTCEIEVDRHQFDRIGIKRDNIRLFESKRELNVYISSFLKDK